MPSIGEYVDRRRVASGWDVLADFGESTLTAPGLAGFSEYGRLRMAGGDIALAAGDMLALARERDVRPRHNLVLIVQHARGGTPAAAMSWVATAGSSPGWTTTWPPGPPWPGRPRTATPEPRRPAPRSPLDAILRGTLDWNLETSR